MGYYCNTVGFFSLKTRLLYLASCIGTILLAYKHLLECLQHAFSDIIPRIQAHFMRVSRKWAKVAKPNISVEAKHDLFWNRCAFSTYFWTPTCKIPNQHSQWWLEWQFNNIWKIEISCNLKYIWISFHQIQTIRWYTVKTAQAEPYLNHSHVTK